MKNLFLLLLTISFFYGCKSSTTDISASNPLPTTVGWDSTTSKAGYLECYTVRHETPNGYTDRYASRAIFYDTQGHPHLADSVKLENKKLPVTGYGYQTDDDFTFATTQYWNVYSTNSYVPNITTSVVAPNPFRITSHQHLIDTISKSGFALTFQNMNADSVWIVMEYDSVTSVRNDTSVHYGFKRAFVKVPYNGGVFNASGSFLTGFPNKGVVDITVACEKLNAITASNNRNYLVRASSAAHLKTFIKN